MFDTDFRRSDLDNIGLYELRELARELGVNSPTKYKRDEVIDGIESIMNGSNIPGPKSTRGRPTKSSGTPSELLKKLQNQLDSAKVQADENLQNPYSLNTEEPTPPPSSNFDQVCEEREGILDLHVDGFGFVRVKSGTNSREDSYLSNAQIRRFGLMQGDTIHGKVRCADGDKVDPMFNIQEINGIPASQFERRIPFESLVPIYPNSAIRLEKSDGKDELAIRCIDLIAPIGKGQRGLIVAPPKTGKTTLLKQIAQSIRLNYPDIILIVLLIDERPEEVTDLQRSVDCTINYSTFDQTPQNHIKVAELTLSKAKRLVESGKDVVILLDSLTRLTRAYNLSVESSGRILSGGLDPAALHAPKHFFGAARNIENGGSLTIIATALTETGSRMDDVVYEEFKGTGNLEIYLDRSLSERRIFPAIDLSRSGTRKEELLLTPKQLQCMQKIRKILSDGDSRVATEQLLSKLQKTENNAQFIELMDQQLNR